MCNLTIFSLGNFLPFFFKSMIFHPIWFLQCIFCTLLLQSFLVNFLQNPNSLGDDFSALYLNENDECESICIYFLVPGVSIIYINICFKMCQLLYHLLRNYDSCIIFKISYSFVPLNSSQNHYLHIYHYLFVCFLSDYYQRVLFSIIQLANKVLYYFLILSQQCFLLFLY